MKGAAVYSYIVLACCVLAALAGPPLQIKRERGSVVHKLSKQTGAKKNFYVQPRFRLPDLIVPVTYHLNILPFLTEPPRPHTEWTTMGELTIRIKVLKATNEIRLHKNPNLVTVNLGDIKLTKTSNNETVAVNSASYEDEDSEIWILRLAATLQEEEYDLHFKFTGEIPAAKTGLYRADYKDGAVTKYLATTQFETIGFRRMVPGFDEPHFKAKFTISIAHDATKHNALSNSDVVTRTDPTEPALPAGYKWTHFNETVTMSSYLIALVVSEYTASFADPNILGKPVGIYGPKHLMDRQGGVYAANASAHLLKTFENVFIEPYAMQKMDSVAVPREWFEFGAMENYGLNTYRDNLLLYYSGESLESERASIVSVLSHELAHQWFGNLVTCIWWSNIWLNEGFASYVSYIGVEEVEPEYDPQNQFLYDAVHNAQFFDASGSSHPVINTAYQEEIATMSIFDSISYDKGASLIRMMEGFLTKPVLWKGLQKYLVDMKFGNAQQDDLFRNLNDVAHAEGKLPQDVDLKTIMDTFTLQKGLPLVRVSRAAADKIYISQERYRNNVHQQSIDPRGDGLDPDELWEVPIALTTKSNPALNLEPKLWIHKDVAVTSYGGVNTTEWIVANPNGMGYYRTLYDTPLTLLIQEQLNTDHTVISPLTKSQLIDDYFTFADEGYVQYETALEMTKVLGVRPSKETDHVLWYPALYAFSSLYPLVVDSGLTGLKNYLGPKVESSLANLGWGDEEEYKGQHGVNVMLRASLLDWACTLDNPICISKTKSWFDLWAANKTANPIPVDLQAVVFCSGVANGNISQFKTVHQAFIDEQQPAQKTRLFNALACAENNEALMELVRYSLPTSIPSPEFTGYTTSILQNVAKSPSARKSGLAFGFVRDNWEKLVNHTASDANKVETTVISSVINTITNYQATEQDVANLQALIDDIKAKRHDHYSYIERSIESSLTKIKSNIAWTSKFLQPINKWFTANSA